MADSTTRKIVDQPVPLRLTDQDELARRASTLAISKSPKPSDSLPKQVDRPSVKPARVVQQYNPDAGFILTMCQLEKACKFMDVEIATLQLAQLLSVTEPGEHEQMIYDCYSDLHMRETGQADYFTDLDRQVLGFGETLLSNPPGGMNDYQLIGSLATSLHNRFVKQEKLSDVNRAIVCHHHALYLVPEDFVDRSEMTYYLGRSFWCRYLHQNKLDDLDQAVECYQLGTGRIIWCPVSIAG
ncbi:hypothetical protein BDV93DRAFT_549130 [Ceratobasidium sp. AG-I]|nr:hypothetical protein BDV93DRAFT_549130 [Ceratobasidium sp. AG-I]